MTKQFCDICGKELGDLTIISEFNKIFGGGALTINGRIWDICDECRKDLAVWIKDRKERPVCQESQ